jgi:G3E family GTPase
MANPLCEVILIAGFLGAGKTTFLQRMLSWPEKLSGTAILVNEFGKLGIDGELLEGFDTPVVEMANGCICCSLKGDLIRTLRDILDRIHPRRLLIEATGVADPLDVLTVLELPEFNAKLEKAKVVTIVDADFWGAREFFGPLFYNQIKAADLVLLNKIDLQEGEVVGRYLAELREICASCSIVPTYHCNIDPGMLWGLVRSGGAKTSGFFIEDFAREDIFPCVSRDPKQPSLQVSYVTFSFESTTPFREDCFRRLLAALPHQLYRIKGYVLFRDTRMFVNHVGGKTLWAEAPKSGPSKLAFVGWQVDEQEVVSRLTACLEDSGAIESAD